MHIITGTDSMGKPFRLVSGEIKAELCGWGGWAWTLDREFAGACSYSGPVFVETVYRGVIYIIPKRKVIPRQPDVFAALKGFYHAHEEQDLFRAESWVRHLELIEYFQRLNAGCPSDSTIPERGGR